MSFSFASSYLALWIWAIFQGFLTLAIFRQVVGLEKRAVQGVAPGELLVGTRAPQFAGIDYHSRQPIDISTFDGQGGVILFLAASCSACRELAKNINRFSPENLPPMVALCIGGQQQSAKIGK
ncbi:MAG: hypothetical protein C5B54_08230, partial [Acidobacteria bacterium]